MSEFVETTEEISTGGINVSCGKLIAEQEEDASLSLLFANVHLQRRNVMVLWWNTIRSVAF